MSAAASETIFTNGNLITLDPRQPRASAMLVNGDRIVAVGGDHIVSGQAPHARKIDLVGKTIVPGFCDSHIHLLWYGLQILRQVDLVGSANIDELLGRLSAHASRTEGWIQGHGFDQSKMREGRFPTLAELDRVSRTRPIVISRVCGHAVVVNSAALELVTPQQRAAGDVEAGLYTEDDSSPFYAAIPKPSEEQMAEAALTAARVALRTGITSVHTLLDTPEQMLAYSRLRRKGKLPIRVVGMPPYSSVEALHRHGINSTFGDDWLRVGACKLFSDGSLGAQTALLAAPYSDKPSTRGIRMYEPADLKAKGRDAQAKGFQLAIHAIGDQAVRETIDAIEHALGDESNEVHRHRIEHASMVAPDCLERMAKRKIVTTCQPQFVTSDTWTPDRVGPERVKWCYPFKSLLGAGVPITMSSDCPVEKLDAFETLWAAVGRHPWSSDETLTAEEAIRAYCLGSAYAAHMEDRLGSLEAGKLADFVVLSDDPTRLDAQAIKRLKAERVFVGGVEARHEA